MTFGITSAANVLKQIRCMRVDLTAWDVSAARWPGEKAGSLNLRDTQHLNELISMRLTGC